MNHAKWIAHFHRNREQRPEPDWAAPFALPESVLKPLRPRWPSISSAMAAGRRA